MAPFTLVRHGELGNRHVARVELGDEPLDRAALAGGIPALEDHAHRWSELTVSELAADLQTQLEQPLLGGFEPQLALLLGELRGQVDVVQAGHRPDPVRPRLEKPRARSKYRVDRRAGPWAASRSGPCCSPEARRPPTLADGRKRSRAFASTKAGADARNVAIGIVRSVVDRMTKALAGDLLAIRAKRVRGRAAAGCRRRTNPGLGATGPIA